jgi:DNA-binding transcriptional LysR family regulator
VFGYTVSEEGIARMQNRSEQGVRVGEHILRRPSTMLPDWESAHLFLELVRLKSFRAAADHLGVSVNALRDRISDFERSLGVTLITRHVDGVRPTAEGERVFAVTSRMEETSFELLQACNHSDRSLSGEVRLAVTEGLGALWVGSRLIEFQRANPKLVVYLNAAMRSADVLRLEADISVQLTRPTALDLRVVKLGRLHLVLFAAQSYLDTYGEPKTIADLANHRIVLQADDSPEARQFLDRALPGVRPEGVIALCSNVSSVHYLSIAKGAGIGHLPTYVYAVGAPVVPLQLNLYRSVDIWMTYHAGAARIPRVRHMIDWLIRSFSPKTFPWFRDEFIPPTELMRVYAGRRLKNEFDGLVDIQGTAG